MQSNIYKKAIDDFIILGGKIPKLDNLILRGTCIDQKDLIEGWSDLDFSIVVRKLDYENIPEIKKLVQYLKRSNNFKISVTVVTSSDFNSPYHYHGMKPIYYSHEVKNDNNYINPGLLKIPMCFLENLLLYDCITNLVYLIHDLRSQYFSCGDSSREVIIFTRHIIKRSKFILKNAFFVMSQEISKDINISNFTQYFPQVTSDFLETINNSKYYWEDIIKDQQRIQKIMSHAFEQVNYIYETTLVQLSNNENQEVA